MILVSELKGLRIHFLWDSNPPKGRPPTGGSVGEGCWLGILARAEYEVCIFAAGCYKHFVPSGTRAIDRFWEGIGNMPLGMKCL